MFCRKCGKSIPDDSVFCSYCGETVKFEGPTQENSTNIENSFVHGFCSDCGAPLPDGKLTGLCGKCKKNIGQETANYGRCEECGEPLEEDDGTLCKKCADKIVNSPTHKSWHSTDPVEPATVTKEKHGCSYAFCGVLGVFIVAVIIASVVPPPTEKLTQTGTQSSASTTQTSSATSSFETASSIPPSHAPEVKPDLELLSSDGVFNSDINAIHITGKIKNNSSKTLSYVQIQFALYDKSGSQVGTALANTNGLEPGNTWSYDAIGMAANISTFKPINLSGY